MVIVMVRERVRVSVSVRVRVRVRGIVIVRVRVNSVSGICNVCPPTQPSELGLGLWLGNGYS